VTSVPAVAGRGGPWAGRKIVGRIVATVGGLGYSPVAPGTLGTAAAIPLAWALRDVPPAAYVAIAVGVIAVAVWAAGEADAAWGTHDSRRIVVDEVAGYLVAASTIARGDIWQLLAAFVLFRIADVVKPWPARTIDRAWPGGPGVVFDDVAAGAWAAVVLAILRRFVG